MFNRHGDFNFHRGGDADSSTVFHAIAFLVGVLGSILQTKYQSLNKSPFDTHYTLMVAFIVSIIIYISTLVTEMLLKAYRINSAILSNISLLSGALAPVLLTLIIVPPVGWFAFIIWTLLFVKVARDFFCQLYQWFYHAVLQILEVLGSLLNGNAIGQQNVELPV